MRNLDKIFDKTVEKFIKNGIEPGEARLEISLLIKEVFGFTKKDLIINPSPEFPDNRLERFNFLVKRRLEERIPVQYLVNKAYFMDEEFYVNENVLIPRPETEILVEEVCNRAKEDAKIIDIGTGSGCIAIMLAKSLPGAGIIASDISIEALETAQLNAKKPGVTGKISFIHSDLFKSIDKPEKFDVIVSNPPYISIKEKETLQAEVSRHEPASALFTQDEAGVAFYEKLSRQAISRLNTDGFLAVEIGFSQAEAVREIFANNGFRDIQVKKDLSGVDRIVIAG